MNITAIRTWHWMIVGLLIGALYGLASPGERWQRVRVPSRQP